MKYKRISFFLSHPVQYISPLLKALAKECIVKVYYFSDVSLKGGMDKGFGQQIRWDIPLLEGYESSFIKNYSKSKTLSNRFFQLVNIGVIKIINREKADIVVVNGWMYFSVILTIIYAKWKGKKIWLRAENPLNQELRKSKKVIFLKRWLLQRGLFKLVDKFLYIGSQNKKFFEFYGAKAHQLIRTPYSVDNDFFHQKFLQYGSQKEKIRQELGLPAGKKIVLFTAKYINQKRPLDLLKAFTKLKNEDALLVMVGEGALRKNMERFIEENECSNIVLTGFINQSVIAKYYAVADVFVMCSGMGETWGLSVNEAMNFALPVIVSDTCGSSYDLVQHGKNGFIVKEGDIDALSGHIHTLLNNTDFAKEAGRLSKKIIAGFSIDYIVQNMLKNAEVTSNAPVKHLLNDQPLNHFNES